MSERKKKSKSCIVADAFGNIKRKPLESSLHLPSHFPFSPHLQFQFPRGRIFRFQSPKMHGKTDSEVTSIAASSPARSPRRPVYYVQSPSRDSHDGEKTATSFHSTPVLSPMGSPPHSQSSMGRHSRESSSTRFSGSLKPGSRKVNDSSAKRKGHNGEKQFAMIEEEGLLDDGERDRDTLPRRCYVLAFVVGFFVLFGLFSLILYGAAKPQKPKITVKVG